MTTSNDHLSPRSRTLDADDTYGDAWRQAEDHDWPTQLISSIEHDQQLGPRDHVNSKSQAEVDEAILNGIVSGGSGQSSQQASRQTSQGAPIKVLTRPVSSGKDPAAGFSFTKAKPMQQFDFRRPKQINVNLQPQEPPPSKDIPTETETIQSPPRRDTPKAGQDTVWVAAHQDPSLKHHNTSVFKDSLPVPSPNANLTCSQAHICPRTSPTSGPIRLDLSSFSAPPREVSVPANDTLTNSSLDRTNEPPVLNITLPNHSKTARAALASGDSPAETVRVVDQAQVKLQNPPYKHFKDPLTSAVSASKITKSRRRKNQMGPATNGPPSNPKEAFSEDDLLRLLMYRRWQEQQELEDSRATQHQKEVELRMLRDENDNLAGQLREAELLESQKTTELSKIKANKPIWDSKIKRLSAYVTGLANDHKRLREDTEDLHKQHKDVFVAGKEIRITLEDAQNSVEQERTRFHQLEGDARHRIETLAQTIQHQTDQLRNDEKLLMIERDRSDRLDDQVSKITAIHEQLLEALVSSRDSITTKVDNLLHHADSLVPPNKPLGSDFDDPMRPMLEQCVELLQELLKADTVKPEDFKKLNKAMDSFVEGIAHSVEACEESSNSMEAAQKQVMLAVQDQLQALGGKISSEHALSEQISDLREVRATARERLQATESSLTDARREVLALRLKDQEQSRRIVHLETDAAKDQSQPAEAPQTLLRIQELDSRNRDLQSEIVNLKKDATDLTSQLQQNSLNAQGVTESLADTQKKLEAAQEETMKLREAKLASEKQSMLEREQMRKELSKAANMQLANMQSEHMNVVQQLKLEMSPAEENLKNVTRQVVKLKAEKERSEKETAQLQALLKGAQNEKEAINGSREALQLHLKEMEARMQEKDNEYRDMQATLNKVKDQVKAKELEIIALHSTQAIKPSSSGVIEQSPSVRSAQSISNKYSQHRGSNYASVDQNPFVQTANSRNTRHFTHEPPLVDDSQPTEKPLPAFMSLDDLMLEDPFADYVKEGSQVIAGEDISHLFPSTPGAGARTKEIEYSRNSVSHTMVVSETQRRRHYPFREATPHTGSHAMNESRSQSNAHIHSKAGNTHTMPRSSAAKSPAQVTSRYRDTNIPSSHREASITRDLTQPQGSVKDPRQRKRTTVAAGFNDANLQARPSKVHKAEPPKQAKTLGPVIEDSQSPLLKGRSRRITRRKSSGPKEDKFTRRFA